MLSSSISRGRGRVQKGGGRSVNCCCSSRGGRRECLTGGEIRKGMVVVVVVTEGHHPLRLEVCHSLLGERIEEMGDGGGVMGSSGARGDEVIEKREERKGEEK